MVLDQAQQVIRDPCFRSQVLTVGFSSSRQLAEMAGLTTCAAVGRDDCGAMENGDCKLVRGTSDISFSTNIGPAPGLRRKQLLWQNAVRNIIDQHHLYSLRLAGGLERGRHRIIVTDAYIADINR